MSYNNQNFVIEVKSQENYTWQGTITWIHGKRKENFRSALELIKLIDSSIVQEEKKISGILKNTKRSMF